MLSATATWKNGTTVKEWFFQESERIVWIEKLKESCKAKNLNLSVITTGGGSGEPRKKLWGRIGMTANITEREFDYLQSGGHMAWPKCWSTTSSRRAASTSTARPISRRLPETMYMKSATRFAWTYKEERHMKLRECLTKTHNILLVDSSERLIFCGRDTDPGSFRAVRPYLSDAVKNTAPSGTYLLITLDREVA